MTQIFSHSHSAACTSVLSTDAPRLGTPALCHWCTPTIELKLAGGGRWHVSREWLRNSLAPTSNQPPKSAISSFPMSPASASPARLPRSLLGFRTQLPPAWAAGCNTPCLLYLPVASSSSFVQASHCVYHSPALGAPHCLSSFQPCVLVPVYSPKQVSHSAPKGALCSNSFIQSVPRTSCVVSLPSLPLSFMTP